MKISKAKLALLREAQEICDEEDRSTEYMIQFMQDYAGCSFDQVIAYLTDGQAA